MAELLELLEELKRQIIFNRSVVLLLKEDIQTIKQELNNRTKKLFEKSNIIIDLNIELKQKDLEILTLKKEICDLNFKLCPMHNE
jgi:hypothetical protein